MPKIITDIRIVRLGIREWIEVKYSQPVVDANGCFCGLIPGDWEKVPLVLATG